MDKQSRYESIFQEKETASAENIKFASDYCGIRIVSGKLSKNPVSNDFLSGCNEIFKINQKHALSKHNDGFATFAKIKDLMDSEDLENLEYYK